ncbi:MAG: hypothetical protein COV60_01210 [Candidatus Magasanikbacteria bacterium CG11_big_fil_rev_8_21_14_0_20_43_7]|uniref:Endolytic murein transglycosylase n=1 Tax=Candidatus Magasanikbacteria bacterium CG11_big_fil_rev_8_21_14_0_20_43_7 TaxID=1974654 RepID=A0A2H0N303_9BACT|nr:MAG: hypothetical protein COV60_01210 [Candidatus Magasanikbacteria bacterium CG11_big_fil_rev_8_21_14_0_20_43_7]
MTNISKKILRLMIILLLFGGVIVYRSVYVVTGDLKTSGVVTIGQGMSVRGIGEMLIKEGILHSNTFFVHYLSFRHLDTAIQHGEMILDPPYTIASVARQITTRQISKEREITILPGWDIADIGAYLEAQGITTLSSWFSVVGSPTVRDVNRAYDVRSVPPFEHTPQDVSLEGYLRPDTYRIFQSASTEQIVDKLVHARADQFSKDMLRDIEAQGRMVHEMLTMASIIEKEVRTPADRRLVSDIFWRRVEAGMGLQADSTIHYLAGNSGSVFTTQAQRTIDSPWNTYKYAGLPPGPISNPSLDAIMAAIYPEQNEYWYFLTTLDTGEVKYGRTLDEHNENVAKYLR